MFTITRLCYMDVLFPWGKENCSLYLELLNKEVHYMYIEVLP